jgi:hypothetical protein
VYANIFLHSLLQFMLKRNRELELEVMMKMQEQQRLAGMIKPKNQAAGVDEKSAHRVRCLRCHEFCSSRFMRVG